MKCRGFGLRGLLVSQCTVHNICIRIYVCTHDMISMSTLEHGLIVLLHNIIYPTLLYSIDNNKLIYATQACTVYTV